MAEYLLGFPDSIDECVDVFPVVVHVEGRTRGRAYVEPAHERLRAVIAGPDADSIAIQDSREVVGMYVAQSEAYDPAPVARRRAVDSDVLDLRQTVVCFTDE